MLSTHSPKPELFLHSPNVHHLSGAEVKNALSTLLDHIPTPFLVKSKHVSQKMNKK